jgi:hypothetical protein
MGQMTIRQMSVGHVSVRKMLVLQMSYETEACGGNNIETNATCDGCSSEKWHVGQMSVKHMLHAENASGTMSCGTDACVMNIIVTCHMGQMLERQMLHMTNASGTNVSETYVAWDKCQ